MIVAAIMPCRGRAEQTRRNAERLRDTAGASGVLIAIGGRDETAIVFGLDGWMPIAASTPQLSYWQALAVATRHIAATHLIGLANDLWACDDWLRFAVEDYQAAFGDGDGLLGFSGDGHGRLHSCHFLISRALLDRYGGWSTWYAHNFGDRELCERAQQDGCYAKSTRAWLEHCHPMLGRADDDAVYAAGRATYQQDEALFVERRRLGWPAVG